MAREAVAVGERALESYSSRYSRHDFTQAQLLAILVLRQFLKTDYRGVVGFVLDCCDVRQVLGLRKVPHYSTLCYAQQRLLQKGAFQRLVRAVLARAQALGTKQVTEEELIRLLEQAS